MMSGQCVFGNGQAQACAAALTGAAAVDTVKTFGQMRQVFGCNADTAVGDAEAGMRRRGLLQCDADIAAGRGLKDGIKGQVTQGAV